ncbi:MAG: sigma-70 family RNA polymerase sigma factor [Pseudomonadota bacterium]
MEQPLKSAAAVATAAASASQVSHLTLLQQVRAGDQQAFGVLVSELFPTVYRAALRVLRHEQEAEDVAQDVFMKIWGDPPELRAEANLKAWSARVATNGAIDRLRKKKPDVSDDLPDQVDPAVAADEAMQADEAADAVQRAIDGLPERQRLALVLTYYEGLPNKEAADLLEVSVDALESLLARARRALKAALSEQWQGLLEDFAQGGQNGEGSWKTI